MAIISDNTESFYWVVTDVDKLDDGTFDVNLKQVKDYKGTPLAMRPAEIRQGPRRTINRPNDVPVGTIIKVTERTTVDRTLVVNPIA